MHTIPTLVVGGGIAGAALACSLAERENGAGVVVADVDLWGKYSASETNAGPAWTLPGGGAGPGADDPAAITMALATQRYYRELGPRVDYRTRGTVWLHAESDWPRARKNAKRARELGVAAVAWEAGDIAEKLPGWGRVGLDGVAGATFIAGDGWVNAHRLRVHYLNRAQAGGVELMDRWQVVAVEGDRGPFTVRLRRVNARQVRKALTEGKPAGEEELAVRADRLVNAAGPWAGAVAGPSWPARRQGFAVVVLRPGGAAGEVEFDRMPAVFDGPAGVYVRPGEWDRKPCVVVGWRDESGGTVGLPVGEAQYRQSAESVVAGRLPALGGAEVVTGWSGHVDATIDGRAVLGDVPGRFGAFNCNGLGHAGLSLSRGVGEAMAIRLVHDRWPVGTDLSGWTQNRFDRTPKGAGA